MSDSYRPPSEQALRWVTAELGPKAKVLITLRLVGGMTANMDRLTVSVDNAESDVVLRRWDDAWATELIDRETAALTLLADHGLPVPRLLAVDRTGAQSGTPCLLMTALPGQPLLSERDVAASLRPLAITLARIHDLAPVGLPETDPHGIYERDRPEWISDPGLARELAAICSSPVPQLPHVLAHGDYHQLNVLWHQGELTGVVDWTYTGSSPREIDVGHCRIMLTVLFSAESADDFLRQYEIEAGVRVDTSADIRAVLSFGPHWQQFMPRLVAGRAPLDTHGMPERVEAVLRAALRRLS